ncbi:aspartic endopeptidase Pep2 [Aphelenchoides avenae]|nr:aspartic endopeptidase Pep2 [Aphelenchus avenae]
MPVVFRNLGPAKRVGATIVDTCPGRFYPIDCKVKIPDDVKIVMDSKEYVIPGKRLINRLYYPRSCSLNLIATYPPDDFYEFVIGSPFLREYCQTYDAAESSAPVNSTMCTHFGVPVILVIATTLARAFEIPVELRSRQGPIPFRRGGSFAGRAAKTTTRDISEQEGDFTVKVSIGTPPQNFWLLVSHDDYVTYVLGSSCDTGVCPYRARFDGSKSSTYAGLPKDYFFMGNYDTNGGYVSPAKDDLMASSTLFRTYWRVIGDVTIRQAIFGVAVNNSLWPFVRQDEVHYDGVLGNFLGDNIFKNITVPILETALVQKAVDKSLYTIWMQRQDGGNCEYS